MSKVKEKIITQKMFQGYKVKSLHYTCAIKKYGHGNDYWMGGWESFKK